MAAKLLVVATPVGNLEDMAPRALRALRECDFVAAEDTRHSGHLLAHFELRTPLVSYHQFSEAKRTAEFRRHFEEGKTIALISDAGLPGVSDPGERLIRAAIEMGVPVEIVPGPSAPLLALAGSGLPMVPFYFGGFLPVKSGGRRKELRAAADRACTSIYFESPYRIKRMLEDAVAEIPSTPLCLARELTKKFEEYRRGPAAELLAHFQKHEPRGEFCLVIGGTNRREKAVAEEEQPS
jgi:16S rRNA (cytidine1402-2'-O)-methyltransferase